MEIMAPPECKEAGAFSKEECEKVMIEKYLPSECKEAGAFTQEECEKVMKEKMPGEGMLPEGIAGPPPECTENGEFIGEEECQKIIEEKFGGMQPPGKIIPPEECPPVCAIVCEYGNQLDQKGCPTCSCNPAPEKKDFVEEKWPGYEVTPIREDLVLIKNPETGESETVTREQARQWVEENLGTVLPPSEQGEELEQLRREIEDLQRQREEPFLPSGEEPFFPPSEEMPPRIEGPSLPSGEAPGEGGPETWQPQEGPSLPPSEGSEESAPEAIGEESESVSESNEESSSSGESSSESISGSEGGSSESEG